MPVPGSWPLLGRLVVDGQRRVHPDAEHGARRQLDVLAVGRGDRAAAADQDLGGAKGALAGILIGGGGTIAATEGKDVELPSGTVLRVRMDAPLTINTDGPERRRSAECQEPS